MRPDRLLGRSDPFPGEGAAGGTPPRLVGSRGLHGAGHALEVHDRSSGPRDVAVPALGPFFPTLAVETRTVRCSVRGADTLFPGNGMERRTPLGVFRFSNHRSASEPAYVFAPPPDWMDDAAPDSGRVRGDSEIAASFHEPFRRAHRGVTCPAPAAVSPVFHPRAALRFRRLQFPPQPKFNWAGPLCLAALPWPAREMTSVGVRLTQTPSPWGRNAWPTTVVAAMLFYGAALHFLVLGFPGLHYPKVLHLVGWHDLGSQIERIEDDVERETKRAAGRGDGQVQHRQRARVLSHTCGKGFGRSIGTGGYPRDRRP